MRYIDGNRVTLLRNGEQYFPALVEAIDAARREIFVETYIYAGDETGSLVTDALARAAARGVAVHLLIDGFGSSDFPLRFRRILKESGAQLHAYRPVRIWSLQRDRLRRLHRKNACIDGQVAFVGGINLNQGSVAWPDHAAREIHEREGNIHDLYVEARGPVAGDKLEVSAFGPFRPASGHADDQLWNRRIEIVLRADDLRARGAIRELMQLGDSDGR